jgi:hypothetical protein
MKFIISTLKISICLVLLLGLTNSLENHSHNFLSAENTTNNKLTLHVASYNTGGKRPSESLSGWLHGIQNDAFADIIVVGLQEMVDLNVKNIIGVGDTAETGKWWVKRLTEDLAKKGKYVLKTHSDLVGIFLAVFVKEELKDLIKDDEALTIKTGVLGLTGNKGSLSYRFAYKGTTFSVSVAHLAAGQSKSKDRVDEMKSLFGHSYSKTKKKVSDHDVQILFGDLNFRVEGDAALVRKDVEAGKLKELLEKDQLNMARSKYSEIQNMIEGKIDFKPTYKYKFDTQEYDDGAKNRVPSWCDRILYKQSSSVFIKEYGRLEWTNSDHKPIFGSFEIVVNGK